MSVLIDGLDLVGTFVFGSSGATLAVRCHFDILGVLALFAAAGLAGGMMRDALLGATPAAALTDERFLLAAFGGGLAGSFFHPVLSRLWQPAMVFDAVGSGMFAVSGCRKALDYGLDPLAGLLLGVVTAVGGGRFATFSSRRFPVSSERRSTLAALTGH